MQTHFLSYRHLYSSSSPSFLFFTNSIFTVSFITFLFKVHPRLQTLDSAMFLHFRSATVCPNSLIQSQGQMKGVSYKTKKNILACFPPSANWQLPWKQKGNTQDFCQLVRLKDEQLVESSELLLTQGSFCKSLFVPLSISISEETYFNL